jgi:hypothetical protein
MERKPCLAIFLLLSISSFSICGCRGNDREDTVIASAANPSHTYRATIILRQYFVDGKPDTSPTTYVLLDKDSGKPDYGNGSDFKDSQVVMKPSQCGPLNVRWKDDEDLEIICQKCGLALSAVGQHSSGIGSIRIEYAGFPEMSSWETGPSAN